MAKLTVEDSFDVGECASSSDMVSTRGCSSFRPRNPISVSDCPGLSGGLLHFRRDHE